VIADPGGTAVPSGPAVDERANFDRIDRITGMERPSR
jgi:hypothetical protein